jgi:flagellar motor switch protein FliN/FliY
MSPEATTAQAEHAAAIEPGPEAPNGEPEGPVTARPVAFTGLDGDPAADGPAVPRPLDLLLDIEVPVTVELGHTVMPIEELLALGPGTVVELDKLANEPVELLIRDHVVAHGEIIVVDDAFGLRITHIVDPADRVRSLGAAAPDDEAAGGAEAPGDEPEN